MEYIDIVDEENNLIGKVEEKLYAHKQNLFHRTIHAWIINDKKELLIQKRSSSKKSYPNYWDISGAGHIKAGESILDGLKREMKEELGVEIDESKLEYIGVIKSTEEPNNMEFQYVCLIRLDKDVSDYVFEDNEVSEVKYVYFEELENIINKKTPNYIMHDEEYEKLFKYIRENIVNE